MTSKISSSDALILQVGAFILAFIAGLFSIYSIFRIIHIFRSPFTKAVKIFILLIVLSTLLRLSTFIAIGIIATKKDILSENKPNEINTNPLSNILSLIWTLPDIFPLYCFILLFVVWLQVLYNGHADFRPQSFRSRDPINYIFAMVEVFGFLALQILFALLFMFQTIPLKALQIQISVCSIVLVALTFISMLVLCLKFSGTPYRSSAMLKRIKLLLYVMILWGTTRLIYGILSLFESDYFPGSGEALQGILIMTAEYVALEIIPYLVALDSKTVSALAFNRDDSEMADDDPFSGESSMDLFTVQDNPTSDRADSIRNSSPLLPVIHRGDSQPTLRPEEEKKARYPPQDDQISVISLKTVDNAHTQPLLKKNRFSASFGEASQSYRFAMTELNVNKSIELSSSELKRIKKEYFLDFTQLELIDEIKEKRTKFSLGKVMRARYRGEKAVCRLISPIHPTNWLVEDFCTDASLSIKMSSMLPLTPILGYGEKQGKLYLVMPHLKSLHCMLHLDKEIDQISFKEKVRLMLRVAEALRSLHLAHNFHGHLTSFNIFFEGDENIVRIGDSNLLKVKKNALIFDGYRVKNVWSSPQVFKHNWTEILSTQVDVYSYGLIFWELLTKQIPFDGKVSKASECVVKENKRPLIPDETPELIKSIIRASWNGNRELRPKFDDIINKLAQFLGEASSLSIGSP